MLPSVLVIRPGFGIPAGELAWRYSRSAGPGGQSVNTSDSRVELSFDLARSGSVPEQMRERALSRLDGRLVDGVLTLAASEHRSQLRNREAALARLASTLREATAPPPRPRQATRPTRGSVERRLAGKKRRSTIKRARRDRPDD
ncbi:aminoacyl-tRNA hydrolase [Frankia sp. Mgl5]|uniref:Peptide chain release factor 1 n=1 Tax=Parafrankia soli TaxID=2599596 RepID=A0A1S1RL64_9ACTN|nr:MULTISPECIES: alternative ribosome rescue aminoacyl-tRNA hydrolase ArfB [Frankiaceae]ABW10286.1 Class I peptide chain release factor [Frankia sp. EAN1pec]CAI7979365.1 Peptidyl-tRNA hydrolase ArfB [Frankia sp. Hr75.2]MCK9925982.1 aminoacyl-tRNA hydrolase [Frankia sp. Mgl5]OHV46807.1 peptide chain release factor 1 [Parafrankia soli]TCJ36889.1 aminoacyl-tRNA hydrolase [Parafrankia sp. BMG5.11]